jgi:two-component system chemotaxis sensor kinase CheA
MTDENSNKAFLKILMGTFGAQSREYLKTISSGLIKLEKNVDMETLSTLFRKAHSLKGAARSVNCKYVEDICQKIEDIFDEWRRDGSKVQAVYFDVLHDSLALIEEIVGAPEKNFSEKTSELVARLSNPGSGPVKITSEINPIDDKSASSFASEDIDLLFVKAEETILIKQSQELIISETKNLLEEITMQSSHMENLRFSSAVEADSSKQICLTNFKSVKKQLEKIVGMMGREMHQTNFLVKSLLNQTKKLLVQPISTISGRFPQMVRNLARSLGKKVDFQIEGDNIQVDKRILEMIRDSIVHVLRNSIDHGIETPEERIKLGKNETGQISFNISHASGILHISIKDNGSGVKIEDLKKRAIKNKIATPEKIATLTDSEALDLIFETGLSTSEIISEISGRGLGMSIVKRNIDELNGAIGVKNDPGQGLEVWFNVPSNISTARGLLIKLAEANFLIPLNQIKKVKIIDTAEIVCCESSPAVKLGKEFCSYSGLGPLLSCSQNNLLKENSKIPILICYQNKKHFAISVDAILGEQEILIKPLGHQLSNLSFFAGASSIGNNELIPVLNIRKILNHLIENRISQISSKESIGKQGESTIILAEDSITSRALLKNILEASGYKVITANDGLDALLKLRSEDCDLLVSDVDMPGLNGFELTTKVRENEKLKSLPVVLITARTSQEDRSHGIKVGADAYFIKSDFDQSSLLQIIARLLQ